jgi:hypothetical protein
MSAASASSAPESSCSTLRTVSAVETLRLSA